MLFDNPLGGEGGWGGGIIAIFADTLEVSPVGWIASSGGEGQGDSSTGCFGTQTTECWDYSGPGGGGSGGSILIVGDEVSLGNLQVAANGERGGSGGNNVGGEGSPGRIATYYTTSISGATRPTAYQAQGLP